MKRLLGSMKTNILLTILVCSSCLLLSQKNCDDSQVCSRNGQTRACYTGPKRTKGVGICRPGLQTCKDNHWSECRGEVLPKREICDDGIDQNCSGSDRPCTCGDEQCEGNETASNCPEDCDGTCGDTVCNDFAGEDLSTCPQDCPGSCGDNVCNSYFETPANCGLDCPGTCGDSVCNSFAGEDVNNCPQDCSGSCGDAMCNTFFETPSSCNHDCPGTCGDDYCNTYYEDQTNCPTDCPLEDEYEENDFYQSAYGCLFWPYHNYDPLIGCISAVANDDDWYSYCASGDPGYGTLTLISYDSSGEIDLCEGWGNCSSNPGNNEELEVVPMPFQDNLIQVKLISGATVNYELCWNIKSHCGDGTCSCCTYYENETNCPQDCCICGDGYCKPACGEDQSNCHMDCP